MNESLFLLADVTATRVDVEAQIPLPDTPWLSCLEILYWVLQNGWCRFEGRVVCVMDSESNFPAALCARSRPLQPWSLYRGTKCTAKAGVSRKTGKVVQRKPLPIDPHVTRFLADLKEFE